MNTLLVVSRAVHFASALLAFGELLLVLAVARPAWRGNANAARSAAADRRLLRVEGWSLALAVASGASWLAAQAATISGEPLAQAVGGDALALVLTKTEFGRLWILRLGLAIVLAALLVTIGRAKDDGRKTRLLSAALLVAGAYLASLAWGGHSAAGQASGRIVQLSADALHLVAAGAWLGGLPGLVRLLDELPLNGTARAARRFSRLGMASVCALIATGLVNAWYLVGSVPALVGTDYGRLLVAKLALFAAMVALAAVNRLRLTPRLEHDPRALVALRRNARLECAAGVAVVVLVAVLGVSIPGAHQAIVWPFAYTLSWRPAESSSAIRAGMAAAAALASVGALFVVRGAWRRKRSAWVGGIAAMVTALIMSGALLAERAYPTTYLVSPLPYAVDPIARGAALYEQNCRACHGAHGRGDGPLASSLPIRPANLAEHAAHHRSGDQFWWIAHGIPSTPMPGFAPQLSNADIWALVAFLRAQSRADEAPAMTGRVESRRALVAPDFTFEQERAAQQSLKEQRGRAVTLLVLYTLPQSLPRLRELASEAPAFAALRARVIAIPTEASAQAQMPAGLDAITAAAGANVARVYAMFARSDAAADAAAHAHAEFLIDRQGYIRARWIDVPSAGSRRSAETLHEIERLDAEPPLAAPEDEHVH